MRLISTRRRFLLGLGGSTALVGCESSFLGRSLGTFMQLRGGKDLFTRENVEAVPYASLALGVGSAPRAMLVLAEVKGPDLHWLSGRRAVVVTRRGRIMQTVGLPMNNLGGTQFLDPDPLAGDWQRQVEWRRRVDVPAVERLGLVLTAKWQPQAQETLPTLWGPRQTLRVREDVFADQKLWVSNLFWLDPQTGECVASQQYLDDRSDFVRTQTLRPYLA